MELSPGTQIIWKNLVCFCHRNQGVNYIISRDIIRLSITWFPSWRTHNWLNGKDPQGTLHFFLLLVSCFGVRGSLLQTSWRWTVSTSAWQSCPPPRSPCVTGQAFPVATLTTTLHTAPSSTSRSWPPSSKTHHSQHSPHLYRHIHQQSWWSCRLFFLLVFLLMDDMKLRYIFIITYITKQDHTDFDSVTLDSICERTNSC